MVNNAPLLIIIIMVNHYDSPLLLIMVNTDV